MGVSVLPARRTDVESDLEHRALRSSFLPESPSYAASHSLIRERRAVDRIAIGLLCGTAGYIDAVGVLTLMGMFPAHVTGELVGLTAAFSANHHLSNPSRIAVVPTFVLALFVAALVVRSRKRRGKTGTRALFVMMAGSLAVCTTTGFFGALGGHGSFGWAYALREGSIVAAMAFQNALRRDALASACPTTVMTGNLMQLVFGIVDAVAARFTPVRNESTQTRPSSTAHLRLMATAVFTFTLGAMLGGYVSNVIGVFSVALPLVATVLAARRFT